MCRKRLWPLLFFLSCVLLYCLGVGWLLAGESLSEELTEELPSMSSSSQSETDILQILESLSESLLIEAAESEKESKELREQLQKLSEKQREVLQELASSKTEVSELLSLLEESQEQLELSKTSLKKADLIARAEIEELRQEVEKKNRYVRGWQIFGAAGWVSLVVSWVVWFFAPF